MTKHQAAPPARARRTASLILIALGLLLPALSLIPLGSIWLWQRGWLLYWTAFAFASVGIVYLTQRWLLPPRKQDDTPLQQDTADLETEAAEEALRSEWSPLEEQAWQDVTALARRTDPDQITSSDALLKLAQDTITLVAKRVHADRKDPVWQFTASEALAIIERVSRRLRKFTLESIPFGDRLTIAQGLALYRWRNAIDWAERAYDIWRVVRLVNPATAAANEAREQLSKAMMEWGRDAVARRLTEAYILEVGRAAIDLYGGRLRVSTETLAGYVSDESAADRAGIEKRQTEPLRILVAGQTGVGKSSLVNALAQKANAAIDALPATSAFTPYVLEREGLPAAYIIDSPGLSVEPVGISALIEKADDSDLVLWVIGAHRADRDIDRKALEKLRAHFSSRLSRRRPPIIPVATHIDRLRPFTEWTPPYDLDADDGEKSENIRSAIASAAADLGFSASEVVPVSLSKPEAAYNVEQVWRHISDALPEATRAQLLRSLHDLKDAWNWRSVWSQTTGAGRTIAGALKSEFKRSGRSSNNNNKQTNVE